MPLDRGYATVAANIYFFENEMHILEMWEVLIYSYKRTVVFLLWYFGLYISRIKRDLLIIIDLAFYRE